MDDLPDFPDDLLQFEKLLRSGCKFRFLFLCKKLWEQNTKYSKKGCQMIEDDLKITPSTTVHDLLVKYPELEDKLIAMAPPFKKLRNPALKKSIAKVATLKHIASVGNIPLNELINNIRNEVGQPPTLEAFEDEDYFSPKPVWFSTEKISVSLVEGEAGDKDKMTVVAVLREAKKLKKGEIIELISTFLPAPGIDAMKTKGYSVWTTKSDNTTFQTYFMKDF